MKSIKGLWFFGLSGAGKSFATNFLFKKIKNAVIVDGDLVRKYISFDLGYELKDRKIQVQRLYGISILILKSKKFPIISSVYFSKKLEKMCKKKKILPVLIYRKNMKKIFKTHKTYKNKSNVIGKDIPNNLNNIKVKNIFNDESKKFLNELKKLII